MKRVAIISCSLYFYRCLMVVLQANFPGQNGQEWILGDRCHQQSDGQVPVCVVTDLKGKVLLSSQATEGSRWMITRARVNITRFWSASTAFIKCACELTDPTEPLPPLTFIEPYRPSLTDTNFPNDDDDPADLAGKSGRKERYPLGQMDEICVYMGYKDQLDEVISTEDLGSRLLRVFVGSIDFVIEAFSTNDGASYSINCRDRMKYLMDSVASFNGAESERIFSDVSTNLDNKLSRKDVILAIARRAVGDLRGSAECGIVNCGAYIRDSLQSQAIDNTDSYDAFKNYKPGKQKITQKVKKEKDGVEQDVTEEVYFLGGQTTTDLAQVSVFPKFHIITGRMPYSNGSDLQTNFVVTERVPLEYIKQMSTLEPVMSEVFVDHRTGDFWYCPRGTDSTGLSDSKRMYRTYFNRICPDGVSDLYSSIASSTSNDNSDNKEIVVTADNNTPNEVHPCQMLILYREEQSTLNWRSNIIVSKSNGDSSGESMTLHLRVRPPKLEGRAFPCTYYNLADPSISSSAEMVAVALAHARNVGKEVRSATAHLVGDPSLTPGEAIQILGSVPKNTVRPTTPAEMLANAITDRDNFTTYYTDYEKLAIELSEQIKSSSTTNVEPVEVGKSHVQLENGKTTMTPSNSGGSNTQSMCNINPAAAAATTTTTTTTSQEAEEPNNQKITFREDPSTIWRLDGLIHRFNDGKLGFYTEIALITPF